MTELKCPACSTPMDFISVLSSTNPAAIKCPGCGDHIKVKYQYVIPLVLGIVIAAIGLWSITDSLGASLKGSLVAMLVLGVVVEYLYFEALRRGVIPSSLVESTVGISENESAAEPQRIIPAIKNSRYLSSVETISDGSADAQPISQPLVGDLVLTYAIDIGSGYVALSKQSAEEFNISVDNLRQTAEVNALSALMHTRIFPEEKVSRLACPDNMMACGMLFPELWKQIEGAAGGRVVIAVPDRDTILYARADDPEAIDALKQRLSAFNFDETHALSDLLFIRNDSGWQEFKV